MSQLFTVPSTQYAVKLRLREDMLGTVPKDKKVYESYVANKAREYAEKLRKTGGKLADGTAPTPARVEEMIKEEVGTVPELTVDDLEVRGWTGFHIDDIGPFIYGYVINGCIRAAAHALKEINGVKQLNAKVRQYVFIKERRIRLTPPPNGEFPSLERPLRAQTPQGPRVTLVRSDYICAGDELEFTVEVVKGGSINRVVLGTLLAYGWYHGLGQWRSGGYGSFELIQLDKISGDEDESDDEEEAAPVRKPRAKAAG